MKKRILLLLLFVASYGFSQSVNDYQGVVIPLKFDFMKTDNQYRLATLSKFNLNKAGFEAFYTNEAVSKDYNDRCSLLYLDVIKENAFLATKLYIILNDCNGKVVYKSQSAYTKEKDTQLAYTEVLNKAFQGIYALQYKYNGTNTSNKVADAPVVSQVIMPTTVLNGSKNVENVTSNLLYAQQTSNGFQLIDSTPKVIMKVFKTSSTNCYIAVKGNVQGVLLAKENQWFFEYYQNDKLISEEIEVKF
ncbi:hypothetical protein H4V97_001511 [Flavobacterium sp. CG_23.5]|uniref:hypothetical protein n=1 Tax=Flavobacterium sp. CG_23.5 TaxID=2760708 RepID=UPI001AE68AA2|nr:hypothetical protein [Flavobacterium sp. CG_23.5]MBP2283193.1 hypothetical protein [Flavobacterium sp. CG_23.5]